MFGIFLITIIVSIISHCQRKRTQRLRELTEQADREVKLTKYEDGRPLYADYSFMYEQPVSEPRDYEDTAYDGDASSYSPSEASDLASLAMGSFPPTPVPTPMPPVRLRKVRRQI